MNEWDAMLAANKAEMAEWARLAESAGSPADAWRFIESVLCDLDGLPEISAPQISTD